MARGERTDMRLYEKLAEELAQLMHAGVIRPGERLPSVRALTRSHAASPGTVLQAYALLEDRGLVEARARSGYYALTAARAPLAEPEPYRPEDRSGAVDVSDLVFTVLEAVKDRDVIPFGSAFPSPLMFPFKALASAFAAGIRHLDPWKTVEDLAPGNPELRRWVSRRYLESGCTVGPDDIVITSGALDALNLCLQTVTRPGDVVAVESPSFYAALQAIEAQGLQALEIPTHPREGVELDALAHALSRHPIRACWFMTNFQNPLGSLMPEAKKKALVDLLARYEIPLIEDDVYAELYLRGPRPKPAKAFDRHGLVMHCASFSKSLAPGFRVGWAAAGRFARQVERRKITSSLATALPAQWAIVEYLKHGGYERHLRRLRHALEKQQHQLVDAVGRYFPPEIRLTRPDGGYFLWVELPPGVDALDLHHRAMAMGISISPGPMFSARRGHGRCIRLNYGHPWSERMEEGMRRLGQAMG